MHFSEQFSQVFDGIVIHIVQQQNIGKKSAHGKNLALESMPTPKQMWYK